MPTSMSTGMNTRADISTITGTMMVGTIIANTATNTIITSRIRLRFGALRKCAARGRMRLLVFVCAVILLAQIPPARSQASNETLRVENEFRECLYSKSRSGRYAHAERDSDFGLIGECRNQWVAYMDVCAKSGFDNRTCVTKSR